MKYVYGDAEGLENEIQLYESLNRCDLSCVLSFEGYITLSGDPSERKVGIALPKGKPVSFDTLKDRDISHKDFQQSFLELIDGLSKIHSEAKILHRSIVPKNLLLIYDEQSQRNRLVFIDWGHSIRFDGINYLGPHAGNITTASTSVLQQLFIDSSMVIFKPADDMESLVKTYFLLLNGIDLKCKYLCQVINFWEEHQPFQTLKKNLQNDFANTKGLKSFLNLKV